ncbi:MAG: hypothetical protein ACI88S_001735, partial [Ilumatobacter sp.]
MVSISESGFGEWAPENDESRSSPVGNSDSRVGSDFQLQRSDRRCWLKFRLED